MNGVHDKQMDSTEGVRKTTGEWNMANIDVRKTPEEGASLARRDVWDPFRSMRDSIRLDRFASAPLGGWLEPSGLAPAFEVKETKDGFEFKADVPGIDSKDLEVNLTNNRLTISGRREAEKTNKGDTYYTYERSYGGFTRSFTVPEGVNGDAIHADLKDGVLKVNIPKKPEAKPRQVQIKNG
jgi:HSP20 family protein